MKRERKRVSALRRPRRNLSRVPRAPPAPLLGEHERRLRAARAHSPGAAACGSGRRAKTQAPEKMRARVEHDLYYIDNWSLLLDLKILLLTPLRGFVNKNAY